MSKVPPFHTKNEEDHKRSPVWHDNDQCSEGKRILLADKELGIKANKCLICIKLDSTSSQELPGTLLIGDFTLEVDKYTVRGKRNDKEGIFTGVSGIAWLGLEGAQLPIFSLHPSQRSDTPVVTHAFEVVERVVSPQTEIDLALAQRVRPGIKVGETLRLELALTPAELSTVLQARDGLSKLFFIPPKKGNVRMAFDNVTIKLVDQGGTGRITQGKVVYPTQPPVPETIRYNMNGFVLLVKSLVLLPDRAIANAALQLPGDIVVPITYGPALLQLGMIPFLSNGEINLTEVSAAFGPWIIGDTGMVIQGIGYTLDLRPSTNLNDQYGLTLASGSATGKGLVPDGPCNIGYLRGQYTFKNAMLTQHGLNTTLQLVNQGNGPGVEFDSLYPLGYTLHLDAGEIVITESKISGGEFNQGEILLPVMGAQYLDPQVGSNQVKLNGNRLNIEVDLDLSTEVISLSPIGQLSWGELTHNPITTPWTATVTQGYMYLPAKPLRDFSPETGLPSQGVSVGEVHFPSELSDSSINGNLLAYYGIAGFIFMVSSEITIFSPDRLNAMTEPLKVAGVRGWLRIGTKGVDGQLMTIEEGFTDKNLGNPERVGYTGVQSFTSILFHPLAKTIVAQFVTSAVFDSSIPGSLILPAPCGISLDFTDMKFTSTANLVGGNVSWESVLTLDYWQLGLEQRSGSSHAGVVSVRTGCIVLTEAGIQELAHFSQPFWLSWCPMLASGSLGNFILDNNQYDQHFDHIPYDPTKVILSPYPGQTDSYLATCGSLYFNFFGAHFVNIYDARYDTPSGHSRQVAVPKNALAGELTGQVTNLHMVGTWYDKNTNSLADFDFPEGYTTHEGIMYNNALNPFTGFGMTTFSCLESPDHDIPSFVKTQFTIDSNAVIDLALPCDGNRNIIFEGLPLTGIKSGNLGDITISGPLIEKITIQGHLGTFSGTSNFLGIGLGSFDITLMLTLTLTPNYIDIDIATGNNELKITCPPNIDLEAKVDIHLRYNFDNKSIEGDIRGNFILDTADISLQAEGQIGWYSGPDAQYLQARLAITYGDQIFEGGFFLGNSAPKEDLWVLHTQDDRFQIPADLINAVSLTGFFCYGLKGVRLDIFILSGQVELFVGVGIFSSGLLGSGGAYIEGDILGGLLSASALEQLTMYIQPPAYFEGKLELEGTVCYFISFSVTLLVRYDENGLSLKQGD